MSNRKSTTRGFKQTASLLGRQIRRASETRGFAVARVLTHWEEIAGPRIAGCARPVEVSYGRGKFGATLTLLTTGPNAPMLEMEKEKLRERVNAIYGYNAIARVAITQTAATGFSDGQVEFTGPKEHIPSKPAVTDASRAATEGVGDSKLKDALEQLGANVLSRAAPQSRRQQ